MKEPSRFLPVEPENAQEMAAYMKNHFPFLGVAAPERKKLERPLLMESKNWDWSTLQQIIQFYYGQPEREYHYVAIDLAERNKKRLTADQLNELLYLVAQKQWWDSIDAWRKVYGDWCFAHQETLPEVFSWFYGHEDFWFRRMGINLQLKFKDQTNTQLLQQGIEADLATNEFFIQKAIGWSLREYSKTDENWVREFIESHQELSPLAFREGSKYLMKQ